MNDWRGTPIEVGSTIVYAVTQSSHITMVEAIVDEIIEETVDKYWWDYEKRERDGRPTRKSVPVQKFSLKARRLMEHRGQPKSMQKDSEGNWKYLPIYDKKVTLTAIERIVVIPKSEIV